MGNGIDSKGVDIFTFKIIDEGGVLSFEILDFLAKTKVTLTTEEIEDFGDHFSVFNLSKIIIKTIKQAYRELKPSN